MYSLRTSTCVSSLCCKSRPFHSSSLSLSGHNKWSKIKHGKGVEDAKKSALFGRVNRDIIRAIQTGGSADSSLNSALAIALKEARRLSVPNSTIERAIAKATGEKGKAAASAMVYEAMSPSKVALLIECLTDNTNRTNHNIRNILTSHGARLAPVAFMFQKKAQIRLTLQDPSSFDEVWEAGLNGGAEDVEKLETGEVEIVAPPNLLAKLTTELTTPPHSHELVASELVYVPASRDLVEELGTEEQKSLDDLVEELEEDEDCVRVWSAV
ncbi:YebC-like protein [Sistotremastrum niveocremeum HHB9708]|uniref:YebC-like protein n=1 Tax=Sistotremastrum niveocremeum HHB9708 TaxID=1314777 RepID=A0A164QQU1_9AGAM|nr:YebC-like protein [Sistotremastrum niveocremeum HHB9708]